MSYKLKEGCEDAVLHFPQERTRFILAECSQEQLQQFYESGITHVIEKVEDAVSPEGTGSESGKENESAPRTNSNRKKK